MQPRLLIARRRAPIVEPVAAVEVSTLAVTARWPYRLCLDKIVQLRKLSLVVSKKRLLSLLAANSLVPAQINFLQVVEMAGREQLTFQLDLGTAVLRAKSILLKPESSNNRPSSSKKEPRTKSFKFTTLSVSKLEICLKSRTSQST